MFIISQNAIKPGFFVISGRNSGKTTIFRVNTVFRGFHLPDEKDKNLLKLDFSIKHLNQWLITSGFKFTRNTKKQSFTVKYKGSSSRWLKLNDLFDFKIIEGTPCFT
jgi:hypothetical protein